MAAKMDSSKSGEVLVRILLARILVHWIAPLPSDSLVVHIYFSAIAPFHDQKKKPLRTGKRLLSEKTNRERVTALPLLVDLVYMYTDMNISLPDFNTGNN